MRVFNRKDKNGKLSKFKYYEFQFEGKQVVKVTDTNDAREAMKLAKKALADLKAASRGDDDPAMAVEEEQDNTGRMLLSEAIAWTDQERWAHDTDRKKTNTMVDYLCDILENPFIDQITPDIIKDLREELKVRFKDLRGRDMAPTTENRYMSHLKTVLNEMYRNQKLAAVPYISMHAEDTMESRRIQTPEEVVMVRKLLADINKQVANLYDLTLYTGRRHGEFLKFDINQYDKVNKCFMVRNTYDENKKKKKGQKAGHAQPVSVGERGHELVMGIIGDRKDGKLFTCSIYTVDRVWQKIRKIMGLENDRSFVFYSARHTFITDMLDSGASIAEVAAMVGHKNITTTEIYWKFTKRRTANASTVRDRILDEREAKLKEAEGYLNNGTGSRNGDNENAPLA